MLQKLALVTAIALMMLGFSVSLVRSDETLVDENVSLYGSGEPTTRIKSWNLALDGGSTVSISVSVQTGDPVNFEIFPKDSSNNKLLERNDRTSVDEQWTAPDSDTFTFWVEGALNQFGEFGSSTLHITIRKTEAQGDGGGGFDPLPAVVIVVIVLVVLVSAFLIVRLRKQSALPPPPPPEEPPPP